MLLNEIKILRELDREGFVSSTLGDLGVQLRGDGDSHISSDIDPKLYPLVEKFITKLDASSPTGAELEKLFGGDKEKIKKSVQNIRALLNKMYSVYTNALRKPEMDAVAAASQIKKFNSVDEWLNHIETRSNDLEKLYHSELTKMTAPGADSTHLFRSLVKLSEAMSFVTHEANGLLEMAKSARPEHVAKRAEAFMTLLNMMRTNTDQILRIL